MVGCLETKYMSICSSLEVLRRAFVLVIAIELIYSVMWGVVSSHFGTVACGVRHSVFVGQIFYLLFVFPRILSHTQCASLTHFLLPCMWRACFPIAISMLLWRRELCGSLPCCLHDGLLKHGDDSLQMHRHWPKSRKCVLCLLDRICLNVKCHPEECRTEVLNIPWLINRNN